MSKEREYLEHKRKTIAELVKEYNSHYAKEYQFRIDEDNLDISKTFCSSEYCKGCGKCCRTFPCVYSPRDFLDITDLDYMRKILDTGVVSIVIYNNDYPFIIRNRGILDSEYIIAGRDIDENNACILHTENGCMLPDVYRASEGLLYLRENDGNHVALYGNKNGYLYEYEKPIYQESL